MYTKEELMQMDVPQLLTIAEQLGVKVSQDDELEKVVYAILDKAAEDSASTGASTSKRKRTRITKKDTDKVYTVSGKTAENLNAKGTKSKSTEPPTLFNDAPPTEIEGERPTAEQLSQVEGRVGCHCSCRGCL